MPHFIVLVEVSETQRAVTRDVLEEAFPDATVVAPGSWEDAEKDLRLMPEGGTVVSDGILWDKRTAADVYAILEEREMTERGVLYASGHGLMCGNFGHIVVKPTTFILIATLQGMKS